LIKVRNKLVDMLIEEANYEKTIFSRKKIGDAISCQLVGQQETTTKAVEGEQADVDEGWLTTILETAPCPATATAATVVAEKPSSINRKQLRWADEGGFPLEQICIIPRRTKRTNEASTNPHIHLLGTVFCTFMSFAIVQMAVAVVAQSQSLFGDSAIMIVDSLTYLFNWIAEVRKGRYDEALITFARTTRKAKGNNNGSSSSSRMDAHELQAIRERTKRKIVLQMEIFPPIVSMMSLLVVVFFLFNRSVRALRDDLSSQQQQQQQSSDDDDDGDQHHDDDPNVQIMMGFAFFNLFLDILNFTCFARVRHHLLGFPAADSSGITTKAITTTTATATTQPVVISSDDETDNAESNVPVSSRDTGIVLAEMGHYDDDEKEEEPEPDSSSDMERCDLRTAGSDANTQLRKRTSNVAIRHHSKNTDEGINETNEDDKKEHGPTNLNMCSAFTHIFADMLRSIAVIVAAVVAKAAPSVSPEIADGSAAIVVYLLILVSIVPLVRGLCQLVPEYRTILAQERAEAKTNDTPTAAAAAAAATSGRSSMEIGMELASLWVI